MKIILVAGARPNFMKIAPLIHHLQKNSGAITWKLVHTGQHYDYEMSRAFFDDLQIPTPDFFLGVGSDSHARQTAAIMVEFENICQKERPEMVLVVGDVNSTLACAITAKKLQIKVAHVEAGLRSGDMTMPEEINRRVTDAIADYLFATEPSAVANLEKEGHSRVFLVGNIMIDTLFYHLERLPPGEAAPQPYSVLTLHRPANVDNPEKLRDILTALTEISRTLPIYFPVHPRTRKRIDEFGLETSLADGRFHLLPPLPYRRFLRLWKDASVVFTDSGGLQEETTALGIPCFTIRDNTERPITVSEGTNTLVGTNGRNLLEAYRHFERQGGKKGRIPPLWDGRTAQRIVAVLQGLA